MEVEVRVIAGKGPEPRNAGSLQKVNQARKQSLSSYLQKECCPVNTSTLGLLVSRTVR